MSKNFIRGSQTTFHFLRMFIQSLRKITLISLIAAFLTLIIKFYLMRNFYPLKPILFGKYIQSWVCNFVGLDRVTITFQEVGGSYITDVVYNYMVWYQVRILPDLLYALKEILIFSFGGFCAAFFFITLSMYIKGRVQNRNKNLRGVDLMKAFALKKAIIKHNAVRGYIKNYKIGNIPFVQDTYHQHTIITGGSGTGKTQIMLNLLEQIKARGDKAIIYDRMGSYVRKFFNPNKDILLNPFDKRGANWSFFNEGKSRIDFDLMSASLIAESSHDPFWSKAARIVLAETAEMLVKNSNANITGLCQILLKSSNEEFIEYLSKTAAAGIINNKSDKTAASIRAVLAAYINCLKLTANNTDDSFSIKHWLTNSYQDSCLFLSSGANIHESIKPLLSLWLDLSLNALLTTDQERKDKGKTWFIIDELPSLQKLPSLQLGLAESRQFGGCFVISMQLISQLKEIYGANSAESINGLCRNRLIFSTPDEQTARWCSDNLGKIEILSNKENISFGAHQVRDGVSIYQSKELSNLVLPSEIMNLKDLEFYVKMSNGFPVSKSKIKYKKRIDIAEKFIEAEENQTQAKPQDQKPIAELIKINKKKIAKSENKTEEDSTSEKISAADSIY